MNLKKINKINVIIFLILFLTACTTTQVAQPAKEVIVTGIKIYKIGAIIPLTGDGASYGQGEKNAIELALEEINSKGGINGMKVEVIYEDGKCSGKDATTAANKLINVDNVKIILGGACSGETLAIAPIAEQNKVIVLSAFSSSSDITNAGDFIFRNSPSDVEGGEAIAEMIFNDGYKKVAVLTENKDYSQGVRKVFLQRFKKLGGEIIADEIFEMESKDYRIQLTKIKASKPEAIFFNPQTGLSGGLAVKQAKELLINIPYYGNFAFSSGDALTNAGNALNGFKFVDTPGLSKNNSKATSFLNKYLSKYSKPPSDYQIGARYDTVYIIKNAIESCGKIDTECIRDYLYAMPEYDGVIGKYEFDKNGDLEGINFAMKQIIDAEKGEIVEFN